MTDAILERVRRLDGHESEFLQAVEEVVVSLAPVFKKRPELVPVFERLLEPERLIQFRVAWLDDKGNTQVNRGWRIQFNSALGPYKGGCRFHPNVKQSVIKFLGFEQIFKNSLTTLPMGGGKGGSDFDPKGKSEAEVMRFCQSFMMELQRHIGPDTDCPAGDINVGGREIGYMFGMLKRLHAKYEAGSLTGKGLSFSGSLIRPEATGYGCAYFAEEAFKDLRKESLAGKRCIVTGSGNAATYCVEKLIELKAVVLSVSDSNGTLVFKDGMTTKDLAEIFELKNVKRGRLSEAKCGVHVAGKKPHDACDKIEVAFPSAVQNEINGEEAKILISKGCKGVFEAANMPSTNEAIEEYKKAKILYGPGKAANAGGVAVSGLEMSQNSMRLSWTREEVDAKLQDIMKKIYIQCKAAAVEYSHPEDLQAGANIAGFLKVADAMLAQGCV
jgi:glutamate dehydrogenase (NADP+)